MLKAEAPTDPRSLPEPISRSSPTLDTEDEVAAALGDFESPLTMRKRTAFPGTLISRLSQTAHDRVALRSGFRP
jgi:hypothetical protein